jgi:DNA repair exonuclease SbcCD nuclease subunit
VGDHRGSVSLEEMLIKSRRALQPVIDCRIPVSVAIGNHDYDDVFSERSSTAYNLENTFGFTFYQDLPGFGGAFTQEGDDSGAGIEGAENHYYSLRMEGENFLFLTLEYYPRDVVLEWANNLVKNHFPDHHVIVITHAYIDEFGKLSSDQSDRKDSGEADMNNGEDMWNECFKHWKNLRLVFSGHFIDYPRQSHLQRVGVHGNVVNSHFFNYQNWGYENGKLVNKRRGLRYQASVIRLVTVDMDDNSVHIKNFLPQKNMEVEASDPELHPFIQ